MNEDYLWDKEGSDAEIESLERKLSHFSLRPQSRAPVIPSVKPLSLFERLSFSMQMRPRLIMAGLLLISGLVTAVLLSSANPAAGVQVSELTTLPSVILTQFKPAQSSASEATNPEILKVKQSAQLISKQEKLPKNVLRRKSVTRRAPPVLTADELYAYEQLMLAISITGSKLREVKEMANGAPSKISSDSIQ